MTLPDKDMITVYSEIGALLPEYKFKWLENTQQGDQCKYTSNNNISVSEMHTSPNFLSLY